jgi:hypothetical protein
MLSELKEKHNQLCIRKHLGILRGTGNRVSQEAEGSLTVYYCISQMQALVQYAALPCMQRVQYSTLARSSTCRSARLCCGCAQYRGSMDAADTLGWQYCR